MSRNPLTLLVAATLSFSLAGFQVGGNSGGKGLQPGPSAPAESKPDDAPATRPDDDAPGDAPQRRRRSTTATAPAASQPSAAALRFTLKDLEGKDVDLMQYKARVIVVVLVAWDDPNRRQFEDLQRLNAFVKDRGMVLLPVLTKDFTRTPETRSDKELNQLAKDRYNTYYTLLASHTVKGPDAHPFFKYLASTEAGHEHGGEIKGAFTKWVIDRNGLVATRYSPETRFMPTEKVRVPRALIDISNLLDAPYDPDGEAGKKKDDKKEGEGN